MQLKAEQLRVHLDGRLRAGSLAPLYTVAGDESLLALEAQDAIRAAARRAGHAEREVLHADARFDWSQLAAVARSRSLFCARRIIELRIPTGKPGKDGALALAEHARAPADDTLTLVALPRLERRVRESEWAGALDQAGVWIDVPKIERAGLARWIDARLRRQDQHADAATLEFIAERVEGNLLAAHQEIAKLGLLYPAGPLSLEQVAQAVLDVARFEVFALPPAMLAGDTARVLRTLEGLRAAGEALPLVSWAITEEIRTLIRLRFELDSGRPYQAAARALGLWGARLALGERAAQRLATAPLAQLLARCAAIDRLIKGLPVANAGSDPWLELADVALAVASYQNPPH